LAVDAGVVGVGVGVGVAFVGDADVLVAVGVGVADLVGEADVFVALADVDALLDDAAVELITGEVPVPVNSDLYIAPAFLKLLLVAVPLLSRWMFGEWSVSK
jgi:hypothetical protein